MHSQGNYLKLSDTLNLTRLTLQEACYVLDIDQDLVDDEELERYILECSNCGIWGRNHLRDRDGFPICRICFALIGE